MNTVNSKRWSSRWIVGLATIALVLIGQVVIPVSAYGDFPSTSDDVSSSSEVLSVTDETSGDEALDDSPIPDAVSGDEVQEVEVAASKTDNVDSNQTAQPSYVETEGARSDESVAFSASAISQAGVTVYAFANPGVLPAGTTMHLKDVSRLHAKVAAVQALNEVVESAQGVDISFHNAEGIEIEPNGNVEVSMQLSGSLEGESFALIHIPDNGLAENMGQATSTGASFISDEFSLYVIAGSGTEQDPIANVYREYTMGFGETVTILSDEKNHDGTWISGVSGWSWSASDASGGNIDDLVTLEPYSGSADVQPRLIVRAKNKTGTIRVAFNYIHPVDKTHKTVTGEFTARHYYLIHIVDKNSSSYSVQFRNNNGTGVSHVGEGALTYTTEDGVSATRTVSSDFIHTFTISEDPSTRAGKVTLTMPDFPGENTYTKNGITYKFVGWSVLSNANSVTSGNALTSIVYPFPDAHIFEPGDRFPLDRNLTLWAIWAPQDSQKVKFFMRIDDHIPNEPQSHGNASYIEIGSDINYTLKDAHFASDPIYGVDQGWDASKRQVPWPAKVFSNLKAAGKLPDDVTDVDIFKARYRVVWSSVKRENDGWHVDGILYRKDLYNLAYHANGDLTTVSSMPEGVKDIPAGETTLIDSRIPNRYDMIFTGWNTQPDGSGTHYNPGETVVVSEHPELDTSINTLHLYAQWEKSTRYVYSVCYLEADTNKVLKNPVYYGDQFIGNRISSLDESNKATSDIENYLFSYATPSIGEDLVIGEDNSKNVIILYYMPLEEEVRATELRINKVDDKGNPLEGAQFKLTGNGKEKTYTSDADGIVHIPFVDDPGANPGDSLTYTLTEVDAPSGYVTSDETFTFMVRRGDPKVVSYFPDASKTVYPLVVSRLIAGDDGDPIIADANGITVVNTYKASGSWTPVVSKALLGRDLVAGEFTFELWELDGAGERVGDAALQSVTNNVDGTVPFAAVSYDETDIGKTYTYQVVEVKGDRGGVMYDEAIRTVTVSVADNGDGTLDVSVTVKVGDVIAEAVAFVNQYSATGTWTPSVTKTLTGRDMEAEQFSFELKNSDGELVGQATNDADGTVIFDAITYTLADAGKTFAYTVTEIDEGVPGYAYDGHTLIATVVVADNGDGTLKTDVSYEGSQTFTNTYTAPDEPTPEELTSEELVIDEPSPDVPSPEELTSEELVIDEPSPDVPSPDVPTPDVPTPDVPTPDVPSPDVPSPDVSSPDVSSPDVPSPEEPTSDEFVIDEPTPDVPSPEEPTSDELVIDEPTPDEPSLDVPSSTPEQPVSHILVKTGTSIGGVLFASALAIAAGILVLRRRQA